MSRNFFLMIVFLGVSMGMGWTAGAEELWIDDLTWVQNGRVVLLTAPVVESSPDTFDGVTAKVGGSRALKNGYAACSNSNDVYPFDVDSHTPGGAISLPGNLNYPYDATMNSTGSEVWIADASDDSVSVVNIATDTITHTIPVGEYPVSVAFSKDGSFALVACRDNGPGVDNMYRISSSTYAVTGPWVGPLDYLGPGNIALDGVSGNFYMVQWFDNYVHEVAADGASVLRSVALGEGLWQLVVDPDGSVVYVTVSGCGSGKDHLARRTGAAQRSDCRSNGHPSTDRQQMAQAFL